MCHFIWNNRSGMWEAFVRLPPVTYCAAKELPRALNLRTCMYFYLVRMHNTFVRYNVNNGKACVWSVRCYLLRHLLFRIWSWQAEISIFFTTLLQLLTWSIKKRKQNVNYVVFVKPTNGVLIREEKKIRAKLGKETFITTRTGNTRNRGNYKQI